jgi:hypothetical protein
MPTANPPTRPHNGASCTRSGTEQTRHKPAGHQTAEREPEAANKSRSGLHPALNSRLRPGLRQLPTDTNQACATAVGSSCSLVTSRLSFEMASVVSLASIASSTLATPGVSTHLRITGTM